MISNIQEIKQILMKLENYFPCEKVNDENRVINCHGFVIKRQYKVNEKMRCLPCKKNWKALLRRKQNLKLQKLKNKHKQLQTSNLNSKRREKRLRSKV